MDTVVLYESLKKYCKTRFELHFLIQVFFIVCGARKAYYRDDDEKMTPIMEHILNILKLLYNIDYININNETRTLVYNKYYTKKVKEWLRVPYPEKDIILQNLLGFKCKMPYNGGDRFNINVYVKSNDFRYNYTSITVFSCTFENQVKILNDVQKSYSKALEKFDKKSKVVVLLYKLSRDEISRNVYYDKTRDKSVYENIDYSKSGKYFKCLNSELVEYDLKELKKKM